MDNCLSNSDNQAQHKNQSLHVDNNHTSHHVDVQKDMDSARLAWEAWKSNDPQQWDKALAEKSRLQKTDPAAWKLAMKEIDVEEQQERINQQERNRQAAAQPAPLNQEYLAATAPPVKPIDQPAAGPSIASLPQDNVAQIAPPVQPIDQPEVVVVGRPGYAPDSPFAPPPPNSPAYDAAYNQEPAKFYGLNLGIFKLGVTNHGSLDVGVNIGLARGEVQAGLENRVEGELMPVGGPIHARVGAGIGINRNGLHSEVGAGGNFFNLVNVDGDFGGRLGRDIGVDGDVRGRALLVNGEGAAGAALGPDGVKVHGGGNADLVHALGARGGGRFALGPQDTGVAAGVGANVAGNTLDFGPSIDVKGDAVVPNIHLDPSSKDKPTFFPTGDRNVDSQ